MARNDEKSIRCSFCGKHQDQVRRIIAGPGDLGIRPENASEGVLQDIHWSQGSFGYFPSYALGSAFGAQLYYHMKKEMDFEGLLERGEIGVIREYLRDHVHRFGKLKTSREILKDTTGEDFNPKYYIQYLKEKYSRLYDL